MADNVPITAGSGTTIGADACTVNAVSGVYVPLGKLGYGGNDAFTYVTVTTGLPTAPIRNTLTDGSGTITSGGTSQQIFATNANRSYLVIQNSSTGDLWINFTTAAVASQPSIKISAGGAFFMDGRFLSTEAVNIIGATTAQAFTAKQG